MNDEQFRNELIKILKDIKKLSVKAMTPGLSAQTMGILAGVIYGNALGAHRLCAEYEEGQKDKTS